MSLGFEATAYRMAPKIAPPGLLRHTSGDTRWRCVKMHNGRRHALGLRLGHRCVYGLVQRGLFRRRDGMFWEIPRRSSPLASGATPVPGTKSDNADYHVWPVCCV
jgi:hypothetical protein